MSTKKIFSFVWKDSMLIFLYILWIALVERICYTHFAIEMRIAYPLMKRIKLLRQQLFNTFYSFTLSVTTSLTCRIKEIKNLTFIIRVITLSISTSQPFFVIMVGITGSFITYFKYLHDTFWIIQLELMN